MMNTEERSVQNEPTGKNTTKPKRKKKRSNVKPEGFHEFEALAKGILEGQDVSYFEWLHKKHQEVVLHFNLSNKDFIAEMAREVD
ncbi:hypothetical protein [Siminovitchia sp. 179-K 8D1 HS]|uniref:hypothetical protein n=1 Tax=Siminovitchia sp. 179-K 8D1 HS TaxID=3142385 RepID=UPI0039A3CC6E